MIPSPNFHDDLLKVVGQAHPEYEWNLSFKSIDEILECVREMKLLFQEGVLKQEILPLKKDLKRTRLTAGYHDDKGVFTMTLKIDRHLPEGQCCFLTADKILGHLRQWYFPYKVPNLLRLSLGEIDGAA